MKTKPLTQMMRLALLGALALMPLSSTAQNGPCNNPPNCIVNNDLGATSTGDMNSSAATTINGWFVSHGDPTIFGNDCPTGTNSRSVWMWSYLHSSGAQRGEGVYSCYNFQANQAYTVCLWVRNTNTVNDGRLQVVAANGLTNTGPTSWSPIAVPTSQQLISNAHANSTTWVQLSYTFVASQNFTQLWIYPFKPTAPVNGQQYELQIDDIRVAPAVNPASLSITASPATINWCGSSTLTVTGAPAGSTVTWAPSTGLSSSSGVSVTASPCQTTTYTATVTAPPNSVCADCGPSSATVTQQVVVNAPSFTITGNTNLNCGNNLSLSVSPNYFCSNVTYSWSGPNGFSTIGNGFSIPNVTPVNAGVYTVTIVNANGNCTETLTVNVTIGNCGPCPTPPNCIVNNDLGSAGLGDMNSSAATTINGWFVSHGDPTIFGNDCPTGTNSRSIWMWSYLHSSGAQRGEGVYTCYDFQANQVYTVCLWVRNTNAVNDGRLQVVAANGLTNTGPTSWSPIAVPTSQQLISNAHANSPTWVQLTYTFTPTQNFSQLWIYPLKPTLPVNGQQYELQIDDIRVTPSVNPATLSISASPSVITWCGSSTLSVAGVPVGATVTWAPATGLSSTTGATVTASPCVTTTYTATITTAPAANCPSCANGGTTLTQQVIVSQPAFVINGTTSLACGDNLTLSVVPSLFCSAVSYTWTGPNGFSYSGPGFSIPGVTELNAGTYNVVITNANGGCSQTLTVDVAIECPCVAKPDFRWDGCNPIQFYGNNSSGTPVISWYWDFGDGQTSTLQNPVHTYGTAGSYEVCLTILAVNRKGETCCDRICYKVEACPPPPCEIRADFSTYYIPNNPLAVGFVDVSTTSGGSICWYDIDFGDGSPVYSGPTLPANHTYPAYGSYTVCMEIWVCFYDANGDIIDRCSDKVCHEVGVWPISAAPSKLNQKPAPVVNSNIQVFPSPASNNVFVKVNGMDKATVQIYNASGQEVGKAVMSTKVLWQADVSEFAPGVYFVVVKDSKGTIEKGVFVKE